MNVPPVELPDLCPRGGSYLGSEQLLLCGRNVAAKLREGVDADLHGARLDERQFAARREHTLERIDAPSVERDVGLVAEKSECAVLRPGRAVHA